MSLSTYLMLPFFTAFLLFANAQNAPLFHPCTDLLSKSQLQPFYHGVASGDPLPDAVIIWTRVTPLQDQTVSVKWEVEFVGEKLVVKAEALPFFAKNGNAASSGGR